MRCVADGADDGRGRNRSAVIELDPVRLDAHESALQDQPHPGPGKLLRRVSTQPFAEL
jgi:hypothetical protein